MAVAPITPDTTWLVHLTRRLSRSPLPAANPGRIPFLYEPDWASGERRLANILLARELWAQPTYYSRGYPVVCMTAANLTQIAALIRGGMYEPWGLILSREWVYEQGGGPALYMRPEEKVALWNASDLPWQLRARVITLDPVTGDWEHEREWRIPYDARNSSAQLGLTEGAVIGLMTGSHGWSGTSPSPDFAWTTTLPRYVWNPALSDGVSAMGWWALDPPSGTVALAARTG